MIEVKKSVAARVPVRMLDADGVAVSGLAGGDVLVTVEKANGALATLVLVPLDFLERTTDAFAGTGKYTLILPASALDTPGCLTYAVAADGVTTYLGVVKVVDNEEVDTYSHLTTNLTPTRAGYLDKLNVTGNVASSAEVLALSNNTSTRIGLAAILERPDSGSKVSVIDLYIYDELGNMEDPDATPTVTVANGDGDDRSSNLTDGGVMTHVSTGHYRIGYTVAFSHLLEQLRVEFTVVEGGLTRIAGASTTVLDSSQAVEFNATDRANIEGIKAKTDNLPLDPASETVVAEQPVTTLALIEGSTVLAKEATVAARPVLGAIEGSTVLAKEATVQDMGIALTTVADVVDTLRKRLNNRAKLDDVTKTWVIYDDDGVTPIFAYRTYDKAGAPSIDRVYEKVPVP